MRISTDLYHIELCATPWDSLWFERFLDHPEGGGRVIFTGHVREELHQRQVIYLEFEAFAPMAMKEMEKIVLTTAKRWPVIKVILLHRLGRVHVGEMPVAIGVTAHHRHDAFSAAQYLIDTLKENVPIWKKEHYQDGSSWVSAHP